MVQTNRKRTTHKRTPRKRTSRKRIPRKRTYHKRTIDKGEMIGGIGTGLVELGSVGAVGALALSKKAKDEYDKQRQKLKEELTDHIMTIINEVIGSADGFPTAQFKVFSRGIADDIVKLMVKKKMSFIDAVDSTFQDYTIENLKSNHWTDIYNFLTNNVDDLKDGQNKLDSLKKEIKEMNDADLLKQLESLKTRTGKATLFAKNIKNKLSKALSDISPSKVIKEIDTKLKELDASSPFNPSIFKIINRASKYLVSDKPDNSKKEKFVKQFRMTWEEKLDSLNKLMIILGDGSPESINLPSIINTLKGGTVTPVTSTQQTQGKKQDQTEELSITEENPLITPTDKVGTTGVAEIVTEVLKALEKRK